MTASIREMTISIWEMTVSIWDILSLWPRPYCLVWCRTQFTGTHTGNLNFGRIVPPTVRRWRLNPCCPLVDCARFQRLKLRYDEVLSNFALSFNLRRYTTGVSVLGCPEVMSLTFNSG
jgi:hypothetical protein